MLVVAKFGGSSVSCATQFKKVKDIVLSDPKRKIVVSSALGKRSKDDTKLTDLLIEHLITVNTGLFVKEDSYGE